MSNVKIQKSSKAVLLSHEKAKICLKVTFQKPKKVKLCSLILLKEPKSHLSCQRVQKFFSIFLPYLENPTCHPPSYTKGFKKCHYKGLGE